MYNLLIKHANKSSVLSELRAKAIAVKLKDKIPHLKKGYSDIAYRSYCSRLYNWIKKLEIAIIEHNKHNNEIIEQVKNTLDRMEAGH